MSPPPPPRADACRWQMRPAWCPGRLFAKEERGGRDGRVRKRGNTAVCSSTAVSLRTQKCFHPRIPPRARARRRRSGVAFERRARVRTARARSNARRRERRPLPSRARASSAKGADALCFFLSRFARNGGRATFGARRGSRDRGQRAPRRGERARGGGRERARARAGAPLASGVRRGAAPCRCSSRTAARFAPRRAFIFSPHRGALRANPARRWPCPRTERTVPRPGTNR